MTADTKQKVIVVDSSCTAEYPLRKHDIIVEGVIQSVEFKYGEKKILDFEIGVKFLKEGFKVLNLDTETPILSPPVTDETIRIRIADDEVVAKYEELTETALKMRAALLPDGEALIRDEKTEKEDLILFLLGARNNGKNTVVVAEENEPVELAVKDASNTGSSLIKGTKIPDPSVMKTLLRDDISE